MPQLYILLQDFNFNSDRDLYLLCSNAYNLNIRLSLILGYVGSWQWEMGIGHTLQEKHETSSKRNLILYLVINKEATVQCLSDIVW